VLLTIALLLRAVVGLLSGLQECKRSSFIHPHSFIPGEDVHLSNLYSWVSAMKVPMVNLKEYDRRLNAQVKPMFSMGNGVTICQRTYFPPLTASAQAMLVNLDVPEHILLSHLIQPSGASSVRLPVMQQVTKDLYFSYVLPVIIITYQLQLI
jgi:hypothetical protein